MIGNHIRRYGKPVTIYSRIQSLDEDDEPVTDKGGHPVFDTTEIETIARINILNGSEKIVDNQILQANDAIGYFQDTDESYLNENSYIIYGTRKFMMQKPIKREYHIEVQLKHTET